jgi:D-psicose/D-tagatose/L-ribulose 3-epimerase
VRFSYVLPDPAAYADWDELDGDLALMKQLGYDAVEFQVTDPAELDEARLRRSLGEVGYPLCAIQTGGSYATRGNCLCTANAKVRDRTSALLKSFVDLAARLGSLLVFGSLQGRARDEPDLEAGRRRIVEALTLVGQYATERGVTLALEPVNHLEVAWHHTIEEVHRTVQAIGLPGVRMMVDTFHMNIEEREMLAPLAAIRGVLAHVHLSETNRDVLGAGHWDTAAFLSELRRLGYGGYCSIGVYNTRFTRHDSIRRCIEVLRASAPTTGNGS